MRLLIVEDQPKKSEDLVAFSREILGVEPSECSNYSDACDLLESRKFDWVLLDMTIPFEGDGDVATKIESEPLGGKLLLREAIYQHWTIKVVVVTQYSVFEPKGARISFEELEAEIREKYSSLFQGMVCYQRGENTWKDELRRIILK